MTNDQPRQFNGILVPVASPCDEQDVFQEDKFAAMCESMYARGAHGLYVCGGTGDGFNMLISERKRAIEIAVQVSRSCDGTVIDHVGARNSRDAILLAEHAAEAGAHAVSSMPPPLLTFDQLHEYYCDISNSAQLPVLVYHIPMITGVHLTADEMIQLLDIDRVFGLKSTEWNLTYNWRILRDRPDITVFNGMDEFLVPGLLYGATGGIGMWYNFFPQAFVGMYQAVNEGDIPRAMELQTRFVDFALHGWEFGMKAMFEHLVRQRGYADYVFRRPRMKFSDQVLERLGRVLPPKIEALEKASQECLTTKD